MKLTMLTRDLRSSERAREKCTFHMDFISREQSVSVFFRFELFCLKVDMSVRLATLYAEFRFIYETSTSSSSRAGTSVSWLSIVCYIYFLFIKSRQLVDETLILKIRFN